MRLTTARNVQALADEVIRLINAAAGGNHWLSGTKESAALRRRSMDLTRALADLRQGR